MAALWAAANRQAARRDGAPGAQGNGGHPLHCQGARDWAGGRESDPAQSTRSPPLLQRLGQHAARIPRLLPQPDPPLARTPQPQRHRGVPRLHRGLHGLIIVDEELAAAIQLWSRRRIHARPGPLQWHTCVNEELGAAIYNQGCRPPYLLSNLWQSNRTLQ